MNTDVDVSGMSPPWLSYIEPRSKRNVFLTLLLIRLVNAICTHQTFFQPDEYFQALEPAWHLAFGPQSGAWMTWEWQYHLRSSLHPGLFAQFYVIAARVLAFLHVPSSVAASALVFLPKAVQAVLAALADYYTWRFASQVYAARGSLAASSALWMTVLNPWQWYCSTRTFSNSLEMTLTIIASTYWPWHLSGDNSSQTRLSQLRLSLFLAATAVLLRPTNLIIWAAVAGITVTHIPLAGRSSMDTHNLTLLLREALVCGVAALTVSALSDRLYFQQWTFPPYHWLNFNLNQDLAVFYGRMDWHYYLSQGVTQLAMTFLPFALTGLYQSTIGKPLGLTTQQRNVFKTLSIAVIAMITVLSLIEHKEVRFIYPLLPILHIMAAPSFASFFFSSTKEEKPPTPADTTRLRRRPLFYALVAINTIIALYLSLFHASAPVSVTHFLRHEFERLHPDRLTLHTPVDFDNKHYHISPSSPLPNLSRDAISSTGDGDGLFALFLTPCHTTPWRSHLVYPSLRARALTCEPPLDTAPGSKKREEYQDETTRFFSGVTGSDASVTGNVDFFRNQLFSSHNEGSAAVSEMPRYIVGFEHIEPTLREFFKETARSRQGEGKDAGATIKLKKVWRGWNGLFSDDDRKTGYLAVWDTGVFVDRPRREETQRDGL